MTPDEIIDSTISFLDRPDLREAAVRTFPKSLRSCHLLRKIPRDVMTGNFVNFDVSSGVVELEIPRCREVLEIYQYGAYAEPLPGTLIPAEDSRFALGDFYRNTASLNQSQTNYYGTKFRYVFTHMNHNVRISAISDQTQLIQVIYLSFPEVVLDDLTLELTTDSWIVREFPELVEARLAYNLAYKLYDRNREQSLAQSWIEHRDGFLNLIAEEIL